MRTGWLLYQCPANPTEDLQRHVCNVAWSLMTQLYHQIRATDVEVQKTWTWGDGRDGRRRLHLAYGQVDIRDSQCQATTSLVVVGSEQPFGIVVLGSEGAMSRIQRQLWCVDAARELAFYTSIAGMGVEDRGDSLDGALSARSVGLLAAAGANSWFHTARSERVPEVPLWTSGSLRPRTWIPVPALSLLAEYSRPTLYGQLLLDIAQWRAACLLYGVGDAQAPPYTTCGHVENRAVFSTDLWIWALGQVVESVEGQLRSCAERKTFSIQPLKTGQGRRAHVVELHQDGTEIIAGFFVREEDLSYWMAAPVVGVLVAQLLFSRLRN